MSTTQPSGLVQCDPLHRGEPVVGEIVGTRRRRDSPYPLFVVDVGGSRFVVSREDLDCR